jgi:outer membrane protein OmpA-like peptidoglycan-associated protein
MNSKYLILIFFLFSSLLSVGQKNKSKGDVLFFEYEYRGAIREYLKEMKVRPLSAEQTINLADAYFKIEDFDNAVSTYQEIYGMGVEMSPFHFNKMLQSMSKTSGMGGVQDFVASNNQSLSPELLENAEFNFELLKLTNGNPLDFKIFNVSNNSPQSDFAPAFYGDNILFTSARSLTTKNLYEPSGESYLDIFSAKINAEGDFYDTKPFAGIPNTEFHQGTPYFSESLGAIFYIRSNEQDGYLIFDDKGKNTLALGSADSSGNFRFLLKDLSTSFYYPFYDAASGKLYFAANFADSFGGTDLYYVYTNNGLIMSSPINLGPRINTPGNEIAPFIFEGSIYFSSDVFYGYGGMDIYKSEILDDGIYSIPVNLGEGLNSEKDDFGFIIENYKDSGLRGYFSSNRVGGNGNDDIYGFTVKEKPGIKTFAISGNVINLTTNDAISEAQIRLLNSEGQVIKEVYSDADGSFRAEVPWQEQITVQATKDRHSIFSDTYQNEALEDIQKTPFNMGIARLDDLVEEKEGQTVIKLPKFYFDKGKTVMNDAIAKELDKVVDIITRFPQIQLRIESHTDSRGGGATNFRLSQARADAIKDYLESHGVSSSNILYSVGYGEDKLINDCTNGVFCLDTFHKQNERQLLVILNYDLLF